MTDTPAIAFLTLGCPKNEVDSDLMRASVLGSAYRLTDDFAEADIIVLNTCGFISEAVEESIAVALDLAEWRDAVPGRRLVVAGCMVSRYGDELSAAMPEADAYLPVASEPDLLARLEQLTGTPASPVQALSRTLPGPSAYLRISDGCSRRCAYCTIPSIRGPYHSRPLTEIAEEAITLTAEGARELVLIGQDTSAWGHDLNGPGGNQTVSDVLRTASDAPGLRWLRLMYVQPDGVTPDLLETMAALPEVVHYLDIPLQHASRSVLGAMGRSGSAEEFLELIDSIRRTLPSAALRSTFIAGYPGETAADLESLIDFIELADLDYAGVFPFSPEEGTRAATLKAQLPAEERIARANRVREAADAVGTRRAADRAGQTLEVLVEGLDEEGLCVGRWRGQAPEIDGQVYLDREVETGSLVVCRAVATCGYDLEAEVLV